MKKKILAMLLAIATMASVSVMPAMAETVTTVDEVLYETDFENFTALADGTSAGIKVWGGWKHDEAAGFSGKGGFIATGVNNNDRNINILASGSIINEGVIEITAKYYPSAYTNKIQPSRSYNANYDHTFTIPTDIERKWYDLDVIMDLDSDLATVTLSADGNEAYTESKAYTYGFMELRIAISKTSGNWTDDNTARIDDVKIAKVTKTEMPDEPEPPVVEEPEIEIPAGEEKVYFNNFNLEDLVDNKIYYGILGEGALNTGYTAPVISSWMVGGIVSGFEGNGFALQMANETRDIELVVPQASEGTYKLTYDFYPSAGTDVVNLSGSMTSWAGRVKLLEKSGLERKWYKAEIVVNLDTDTATASLTDGDGNQVYTNSIAYTNNLVLFEFSRTVAGGTAGDNASKAPILDNILVIKSKPEPVVLIESKSGTKETDLTAVNPAVGNIAIDFGEEINEDTLTEETVTLKAGTSEIATVRSYANGIYTLVPAAKLSPLTEYELSVTSDVLYVDNNRVKAFTVKFTTEESENDIPEMNDNIIYATDFEDFTALADGTAAGIKVWGGYKVDEAAGFEGKGLFVATGVNNNDRSINILVSGSRINDGVIKMTAKYYPSEFTNQIRPSRSYNANYDHIFTVPASLERKWYDLEVLVDMDTDLATVTLSADGVVAHTENKAYALGLQEINIYVGKTSGSWTDENTAKIDDVVVERIYSTAPVVTDASVVIYAGETAQNDYKAISSLTDKVTVNFGQPVKSSYLNDEYIYIEKISDSTKVPYTAAFANNTYTMVFDELLEANTDYRLVVKEVENLSGLKSEAYEKSFTVGKAVLSATLKGITQLTFPVTTVAGLTKGEDAIIEIDYKNSKKEDTTLYLVVAYYSGNRLLKAEYVTKDVAKEVIAATYKFNYKVPAENELSGYDSVKVMMWNGFSSMIPLSQSIELK